MFARAAKDDVTPAEEKFREILRQTAISSERKRDTKLLTGAKDVGRIFTFDVSARLVATCVPHLEVPRYTRRTAFANLYQDFRNT
jgi:hypothetical protein